MPARISAAIVAIALAVGTLHATSATAATVAPPEGAGRPVAATGIGTKAALENPRCTKGARYGVYGRFDSAVVGGGPICVKPWTKDDDNGGATHQGVTADTVTVVAVVPNELQLQAQVSARTTTPQNRATSSSGSYADAINDHLQPLMEYHETWGRDIEVVVVESSGDDEAAQRADAVKIRAEKPFAVLDMNPTGLDVLDAELANSKIPVWGFSASSAEAVAQAPYRWGQTDAQASAVNAAEVVGKQLVGKKAEFGGDDVKSSKRVFGAVFLDGTIDSDGFEKEFAKYGGKLTSKGSYESNGSTRGEADKAQAAAPSLVSRMKAAGVTTVILFTDIAMTTALMTQAKEQQWFPEWYFSGSIYHDLALLARSNPPEEMAHAFGVSNFSPWIPPELVPTTNPLDWYWGENVGTTSNTALVPLNWLLLGIHTAGPKLTPKSFRQGLFSSPGTGGAATGGTVTPMTGYGKNAGLPYDEYMITGFDFVPIWWDPETTGPSAALGTEGKGVWWYLDGAKRYKAGDYPKKPFSWFDATGAITGFDTYPDQPLVLAPACTTCPATTGAQPGAAEPTTIVGPYGGTRDAAKGT